MSHKEDSFPLFTGLEHMHVLYGPLMGIILYSSPSAPSNPPPNRYFPAAFISVLLPCCVANKMARNRSSRYWAGLCMEVSVDEYRWGRQVLLLHEE